MYWLNVQVVSKSKKGSEKMGRYVSITKQRQAYNKTKGICIICGKKISKDEKRWSVDHFIPRAVYKWVPDEEIKKRLEGEENVFIVHEGCNFDKDSLIFTAPDIKKLQVDRSVREEIYRLYKDSEECIRDYRAMKQSTLDLQKKKCAACDKELSFKDATMRRIDRKKKRTKDNAMCVCGKCNLLANRSWNRNKMKTKVLNQK